VLGFFRKHKCIDKKLNAELTKLLGFKPKNFEIYYTALTHKSATDVPCYKEGSDNERLEFLGDAILDAVISELLYLRFPTADEGFLTQMRTKIVNGKQLAELAVKVGIDKLVFKSKRSTSSVRIYEDAFEAIIGAIYLDRGLNYTKKFISQKIMIHHIDLNKLKSVESNFKSKVIEWSQKNKINLDFYTDYETVDSKVFICYIRIDNKILGTGKAYSKKGAEQIAAKLAFEKISNGFLEE